MTRHYYSDTAQPTTLTSSMTNSQTTMVVAATTGFPSNFPYYLVIDRGVAASLEVVRVTSAAGLTLTITRAVTAPTTAAVSHLSGAAVAHVAGAEFFNGADAAGGSCIAQISRTTSSSAGATSPQGVLRLDDVPVKAGRLYSVVTSTLEFLGTVINSQAMATLRYTTDGTTPTTTSSAGAAAVVWINELVFGTGSVASFLYAPATDLNFSVTLYCQRTTGTGNVYLYADATSPCALFIIDLGLVPTAYGTVL